MKKLTTEEFKEKIFNYEEDETGVFNYIGTKPCIIDFYADWCSPCKMLSPILEELSTEYPEIDIWKVDVDSEVEISQVFGIKSLPSILFLPIGSEPSMTQGALPKEQLKEYIENVLLNKDTE